MLRFVKLRMVSALVLRDGCALLSCVSMALCVRW